MTDPINAVDTSDGRFYERNGRRYLSVTNVLDHAMSKPALIPWAVKLTAEEADRTLAYALEHGKLPALPPGTTKAEKASKSGTAKDWPSDWKREHKRVKETSGTRGNLFHSWAEAYLLGGHPDPPELPPEVQPYHGTNLVAECAGFIRAVEKYGIEAWGAEATVYSDHYNYAGTGDLWAYVRNPPSYWPKLPDDGLFMFDVKTSKSAWPETALQLAAYRHADYIGLPDGNDQTIPDTVGGGVLHVDGANTHLIPYRCGLAEFEAFLGGLRMATWMIEDMKNVKNWTDVVSE